MSHSAPSSHSALSAPAAACDVTRSTLLLIDLQARLMPAIHDAPTVIANALRLANGARVMDVPVRATEQNPRGLGPSIAELATSAGNTLAKQFFDATREPGWPGFLPEARPDIVAAGCEAHVCVLQTVLGLRARGHRVLLVTDAIGARTPANKAAAILRAERAGAECVTTEMVLFEWLGTAQHPAFKSVLEIVR